MTDWTEHAAAPVEDAAAPYPPTDAEVAAAQRERFPEQARGFEPPVPEDRTGTDDRRRPHLLHRFLPRSLRAQVVVLHGASSGLGRATARAFARHGAHLVLSARGDDALEAAATECRAAGAEVLVVPADVGTAHGVDTVRRAALARFGRVDVWVDAASALIAGPVGAEDPAELHRLVLTNVEGPALVARAALATFREQGHGTLVLVGSLLGIVPNPVVPYYVMGKFAVRGLALSLRQAVVDEDDIHVTIVLPGPIDTPLFQRAANHTGRRLRAIPPAAAPERVAAAVVSAARRPRRQVTAGVLQHALLAGHRLAPRSVERAVAVWAGDLILQGSEPAEEEVGTLFGPAPGPGRASGDWRLGDRRRRIGAAVGRALGG